MGPSPHLWDCVFKRATLGPELHVYVSQPSSVVFGCTTATFGPEQQVCMGPRCHLSLCARKTA